MNALLFLFRLRSMAAFRQLLLSFKTPEGAIRTLFTASFCFILCVPLLAIGFTNQGSPNAEAVQTGTFAVSNLYPFLLAFLAFGLSQQTNESLAFSQAEIDMLFSGPFSRRELLIFKLLGIVTSSAVICLALTVLLGAGFYFLEGSFIGNFVRGYVSIFLATLFLRFFSTLVNLVRNSIFLRFYSPLRKMLGYAFFATLLFVLFSFRDQLNTDLIADPSKVLDLAKEFLESDTAKVISWPFKMFSNILLAKSILGIFLWIGTCLLAIVGIFVLLVQLDANFLDASVRFSKLKAEMALRQQSVEASFVPSGESSTLPMLPFFRGTGPLAWRQLQTFYRSKKYLLFALGVYYGFIVFLMFSRPEAANLSNFRFSIVATMVMCMSCIMPIILPMGFQNDSDKMTIFKGLPFNKWQIAGGQLLGPTLAITAAQFLTIALFIFTAIDYWAYWFALALFAPLVTVLILSIVNSLALLYPTRHEKGVVRELENVGHILVFVFLLFVVSSALVGALTGVGAAVYFLTYNIPATLVACWIALLAASAGGIWITGLTFERFDVSRNS